jgi:hypothetical protein
VPVLARPLEDVDAALAQFFTSATRTAG